MSEPVLLSLHLDAEESLEDGVALLGLAISPHRLIDPRVGRKQFAADGVRHMVAVSLGGGHEGLDAAELQALLAVEYRAEQALLAREHPLHGLRVGHVERRQSVAQPADVQFQRG